MKYWEGYMNWPLDKNWKCEFCEGRSLTWGLPHAVCRCNNCHVQYKMRDKKHEIVDIPICLVKPEYYQIYKDIFEQTRKPIDEVTDEEWEEFSSKMGIPLSLEKENKIK